MALGTVSWTLLETSDGLGGRRRVGFVRDLEVPETVRRRGHGTALLDEAFAAMRLARCEWALAVPSPDAVEFYANLAWRPLPLLMCEGTPGLVPSASAGYAIRQYEPTREAQGWPALADVYAVHSERQPGAAVRDAGHWATSIARYVSGGADQLRPRGEFFVAESPAVPRQLAGYALVHWWHLHPETTCYFDVAELCTRPGEDGLAAALLAEIGERAAAMDCSMRWCRLFLPREPAMERAIAHILRDPEWSTFVELRAKSLTDQDVVPQLVCWSMDVLEH